jgi:hypothetical protein
MPGNLRSRELIAAEFRSQAMNGVTKKFGVPREPIFGQSDKNCCQPAADPDSLEAGTTAAD